MSQPKVTVTFKRQETDDSDSDVSYLEPGGRGRIGTKAEQAADAERLAAYRKGDWHMIGIRAVATIWVQRDSYRTNYEITSPGLWGIESDSEESYLQSVYKEECSILQTDIAAMGAAEFKL